MWLWIFFSLFTLSLVHPPLPSRISYPLLNLQRFLSFFLLVLSFPKVTSCLPVHFLLSPLLAQRYPPLPYSQSPCATLPTPTPHYSAFTPITPLFPHTHKSPSLARRLPHFSHPPWTAFLAPVGRQRAPPPRPPGWVSGLSAVVVPALMAFITGGCEVHTVTLGRLQVLPDDDSREMGVDEMAWGKRIKVRFEWDEERHINRLEWQIKIYGWGDGEVIRQTGTHKYATTGT